MSAPPAPPARPAAPAIEIRPLGADDTVAYLQLRRQALLETPLAFGESVEEHDARPVEAERARLAADDADSYVLGAFRDGELLGMVGLTRGPRQKSWHRAAIWGVTVDRRLRGQGVGRRLIEAVLARARTRPGLEAVWLTVTDSQMAARELYARLGFTVFGRVERALCVGATCVGEAFMEIRLDPLPECSPV